MIIHPKLLKRAEKKFIKTAECEVDEKIFIIWIKLP